MKFLFLRIVGDPFNMRKLPFLNWIIIIITKGWRGGSWVNNPINAGASQASSSASPPPTYPSPFLFPCIRFITNYCGSSPFPASSSFNSGRSYSQYIINRAYSLPIILLLGGRRRNENWWTWDSRIWNCMIGPSIPIFNGMISPNPSITGW